MWRSTPVSSVLRTRATATLATWLALVAPAVADPPGSPAQGAGDPLPTVVEAPGETWLEAHGIGFEFVSKADVLSKVRGGLSGPVAARYRGHVDFVTTLDTGRLGLWSGGKIVLVAQNGHGRGISERHVGDVQALSNIDARSFTQMSEWFLEQALAEGRFRVKIGRQDAGADFAFVEFGAEFLNSSFGLIPTAPVPTFPDPALGISAFADLTDELSAGMGVYRPTSLGWGFARGLTVGFEVGFGPRSGNSEPATRYRAGFWYQRGSIEAQAPATASVYGAIDRVLVREGGGEQGLRGFLQVGTSSGAPNGVSDYLGAGVVYTGLLPGRDEDRIGLGVAHARLPAWAGGHSAETDLELLYRVSPWPWLTLQPSVHWVLRPGGQGRNALVAGVRFETQF